MYEVSRIGKYLEKENKWFLGSEKESERGVTTSRYRISSRVMKTFLNKIMVVIFP